MSQISLKAGLFAMAGTFVMLGAQGAYAACEGYPTKPVTIIVPFPAGSATDTAARRIAEELRVELGQNFLIDNSPGADGTLAARKAASARPDGHTLFITTNTTHSANPAIYSNTPLPYDPEEDFSAISGILQIPYLLAVSKTSPVEDFEQFRAAATADAPLTFGSGAVGARGAGELLRERLDGNMTHVAYRGSPQGLSDLVAGRLGAFFADPASALGVMDQIRVIGVTGPSRIESLPDVPTIAEMGIDGYAVTAWVAAFAPAETPDAVVSCLTAGIDKALKDEEIAAFLASIGSEPMHMGPDELNAFIAEDAVRWQELVEVANIERK